MNELEANVEQFQKMDKEYKLQIETETQVSSDFERKELFEKGRALKESYDELRIRVTTSKTEEEWAKMTQTMLRKQHMLS